MDRALSALLIALCGDDVMYIFIKIFMHTKMFPCIEYVSILCRRDAMNSSKMDNDEG